MLPAAPFDGISAPTLAGSGMPSDEALKSCASSDAGWASSTSTPLPDRPSGPESSRLLSSYCTGSVVRPSPSPRSAENAIGLGPIVMGGDAPMLMPAGEAPAIAGTSPPPGAGITETAAASSGTRVRDGDGLPMPTIRPSSLAAARQGNAH